MGWNKEVDMEQKFLFLAVNPSFHFITCVQTPVALKMDFLQSHDASLVFWMYSYLISVLLRIFPDATLPAAVAAAF